MSPPAPAFTWHRLTGRVSVVTVPEKNERMVSSNTTTVYTVYLES